MRHDLPASLHIIGGRKLGGAERFYVRLVNALAARGAPLAALTVAGGEIDAALHPDVPRIHAPLAGVWDLWSRWRIRRAARNFAIVQTYMGRATRLTHLPQDRGARHLARLGGYYALKGYRHAHAWVGNTRGIRDYLLHAGLPPARVFYIGNFVDPAPLITADQLAALRQQWRIPATARVVLGLARLHPNKGLADLLTAFARLPAALDARPLWLVMVGDGPLRQALHDQAQALGITARVTWSGWQYDPAPWYQMAEVFVCPSRHEPLGNVVLEAWANGVPVVSSAAQGPSELIAPGRDGWLVPVGDAAALHDAVLSVLHLDNAARTQVIAAGRHTLASAFSEAAIVDAYLALYRQLVAES